MSSHLLLIRFSLWIVFYLSNLKLYFSRDQAQRLPSKYRFMIVFVDAKLACVIGKARKVIYSQRGLEALRF